MFSPQRGEERSWPHGNMSAWCVQGGDCFDVCTVLCSLLLGAGFDAYVVAGYAPLAVTISDQTSAVCPLLEPQTPKAKPYRMQPAASQKHPVQPKEAKYLIKSTAKPESAFLQVLFSTPANSCSHRGSVYRVPLLASSRLMNCFAPVSCACHAVQAVITQAGQQT